MAATDLGPTIGTNAASPQSASVDNMTVSSQPIVGVIAADQYLAAKAARGRKFGGAVLSKIRPAGCPADQQGTGNFQYLGQQGF